MNESDFNRRWANWPKNEVQSYPYRGRQIIGFAAEFQQYRIIVGLIIGPRSGVEAFGRVLDTSEELEAYRVKLNGRISMNSWLGTEALYEFKRRRRRTLSELIEEAVRLMQELLTESLARPDVAAAEVEGLLNTSVNPLSGSFEAGRDR